MSLCTFLHTQDIKLEEYASFDDFVEILYQEDDRVYVVNFWATWCGPCVKELPLFEEINTLYEDDKVSVILVSLDFENQIDTKLIPFIHKNKLRSRLVALFDGKYNDWIDKVSPDWSGSIPATLIYSSDERLFLEGEFHELNEILGIIEELINHKKN